MMRCSSRTEAANGSESVLIVEFHDAATIGVRRSLRFGWKLFAAIPLAQSHRELVGFDSMRGLQMIRDIVQSVPPHDQNRLQRKIHRALGERTSVQVQRVAKDQSSPA